MVKAQKPKKESSSEASSSSKRPKPQNILFLSDKEKAKLECLAWVDNIANSMKTLGKSAIKASSTHTRISDELAANEPRFLELQQEWNAIACDLKCCRNRLTTDLISKIKN